MTSFGRDPALAASLSGPSKSLRFRAAFPASKTDRPAAFRLGNLRGSMLLAYRSRPAGIAAVHSAMFGRVNRFNVLGTAARRPVASMVDVFPRSLVKRLVNEAVDPPHPATNPDESVALGILRAAPEPALPVDHKTTV